MDTLNAFFRDAKGLSRQTALHLNTAVRSVSARLGTPKAFEESNFLVVNFMIVQGLVQEDHTSTVIHRNGLMQMTQLAGGFSSLHLDDTLMIKICK